MYYLTHKQLIAACMLNWVSILIRQCSFVTERQTVYHILDEEYFSYVFLKTGQEFINE